MRALLLVVVGALGLARPLGAQAEAGGSAWSPGPVLVERVRRAIGAAWGVEPERLRLEWGGARPEAVPAEDAPFELIGSGATPTWIVAFGPGGRGGPRVAVRAGVEETAVVAARDLERGVVLTEADLASATVVRWGPPARDTVVVAPGWVTRRRIARGEPLREPAVAPPVAVRPGESVRVTWRRGGVTLAMDGTALGAAAVGQRVRVRTETGRRLEGVAVGPALVQIEADRGETP